MTTVKPETKTAVEDCVAIEDGVGIGEHVHAHPCPICAQHLDPVTGNPRYNAETVAAIEEGMAISRGEIPVKWHKPHEFEKVWQDLLNGEEADESSVDE